MNTEYTEKRKSEYAACHAKLMESIAGLNTMLVKKTPDQSILPTGRSEWLQHLANMQHKVNSVKSPPMVGKGKRSGGDISAQWARQARQTRYHLRKLVDPAKVIDSYPSEEHDLKDEVTTAIKTLCEAYMAWEAKWEIKKEQQCAAGQTPPAPVPALEWYSSQPSRPEIRGTIDAALQRSLSKFGATTGQVGSSAATDDRREDVDTYDSNTASGRPKSCPSALTAFTALASSMKPTRRSSPGRDDELLRRLLYDLENRETIGARSHPGSTQVGQNAAKGSVDAMSEDDRASVTSFGTQADDGKADQW